MTGKDDYIIILDFLPHGKPNDRKAEAVAQGIGDKYLNLLEIAVNEGINLKAKDRVYVGDDKRDQVKYIRGRIGHRDLTNYAKNMLEETVTEIVDKEEARFVTFFNKAGPVTTRMHSLELVNGIGKKHMWDIIRERRIKEFQNFADVYKRVPMMPDPRKLVIKRIMDDLTEKDKYKLFVGNPTI